MNKKYFLVILFFSFFEIYANQLSVNHFNIKPVIVSGKIENPNTDSLYIKCFLNSNFKKLIKCKNGVFSDTFYLWNQNYFYFEDNENYIEVYLEPEFNLKITYDASNFRKSLKYIGVGAKENNYLVKKNLLNHDLRFLTYYQNYGKMNEVNFLKLVDSINQLKTNLFNNNKKSTTRNFKYLESKTIEFERLIFLSEYELTHRYIIDDKQFKVSDNFPKPYLKIDLENEKLLKTTKYIHYLKNYFNDKTRKVTSKDSTLDYFLTYLKLIDRICINNRIKEELAYDFGKNLLNNTKKLDQSFGLIYTMVFDTEYKNTIEIKYKKLKKVEKGAKSPNFKFENKEGKIYTLDSFKGKIVFIDVWATWCYPCVKEIPYLIKLQEKYKGKNIVFISICKDDKKEKWLTMLKEKNMDGIQLFAESNNEQFFEDYSINGIPHFIILDKQGDIFDAKAKRPSDEKLINELDLLVN